MKITLPKGHCMHVAVVETDPLRFAGFRAVLESQSDLQLTAVSLSEVGATKGMDVVLGGGPSRQDILNRVEALKAIRADLQIMVTGSDISDDFALNALVCGAKGYIDEAAPVQELAKAIRIVAEGLVWAPRRVVAMFIDRRGRPFSSAPMGSQTFTSREKEVLNLLVKGQPNKEIGTSLGIGERTVKAHVAKLMRKAGVQNRILLSMHAITHSLVPAM